MSDDGALEKLEKKLDHGAALGGVKRSTLREPTPEAPRRWNFPRIAPAGNRSRFGVVELVFAGSVIFFVGAGLISFLLFFSGDNTVSTKNVDVTITGPTEIGAGNTLSLQVVVTNRNTVPMQLVNLIVEFPEGTRSATDITVELPRLRENLGTIEPGQSVNHTIRAIIFGEEGRDAEIKASVEYRVPSSNAIFISNGDYVAKINQAPASILVDTLKETVSGQEVAMTITVVSNAPGVLSNMLLLAEYPPGFSFKSSSPAPVAGETAWNLGDIEPGGKRTVTIRGSFSGEDGDTRVVHFKTGNKKTNRVDEITAPLSSASVEVAVMKPFVSVALALNGQVASEHTVKRGEQVRGDIRWVNNLAVNVQDLEIVLTLRGGIIDPVTISGNGGFYRSSDQTITWGKQTNGQFANVPPGESGVTSFSFKTFAAGQGAFKNPELDLSVMVRARRTNEENVPEQVESSAGAHVVVATDLALVTALAHTPQDTGPMPPKVDNETKYTVTWMASNTTNAVANASVSATLPSYVKFTDVVSPAGAVSYNPVGGVITWNIGDLSDGASKTVSFQVAITPSLSQVGDDPTMLYDQRIRGFDRFARTDLNGTSPPLTTASAASQGQGDVVP